MSAQPTSPRIPPVVPAEEDAEVQELLAGAGVKGTLASNIFLTLVRHRGLFRKWAPFGGKLLAGKLAIRDREILILRTGWLCNSEYEFGQHSLIAKSIDFTDAEITGIKEGPEASCWNEFDATLVRAASELHDESCISDATWATLASRYDESQLIEVVMVVGQYHLVAFTLNSLGVQREPGVPGWDD